MIFIGGIVMFTYRPIGSPLNPSIAFLRSADDIQLVLPQTAP